jgi:hypothetical protein
MVSVGTGGVVFVETTTTGFIPITFTGTSGTILTNCKTNYVSAVIATGAQVNTPLVIDSDPNASVTTFASRLEFLALDCHDVAGGFYSNHGQEDSGCHNTFVSDTSSIGYCWDNSLAGSTAQNFSIHHATVNLSQTAPAPTAQWCLSMWLNSTPIRTISDMTLNTRGLADNGGGGFRLDGVSGLHIQDIHFEHIATPMKIGAAKVCGVVTISNIDLGAGTAAGIIRSNSQTFAVFGVKNGSGGHAIQDLVLSNTLDDLNIGVYIDAATKGVITDGVSVNKIPQGKTGTVAPTTGTWKKGDVVWNTSPAAAGFIGWVCVTAGTPGTWKGFGTIQT